MQHSRRTVSVYIGLLTLALLFFFSMQIIGLVPGNSRMASVVRLSSLPLLALNLAVRNKRRQRRLWPHLNSSMEFRKQGEDAISVPATTLEVMGIWCPISLLETCSWAGCSGQPAMDELKGRRGFLVNLLRMEEGELNMPLMFVGFFEPPHACKGVLNPHTVLHSTNKKPASSSCPRQYYVSEGNFPGNGSSQRVAYTPVPELYCM